MRKRIAAVTLELLELRATQPDAMRARIKLIRKLRWIGIETEAGQLISTPPPARRGGVAAKPPGTGQVSPAGGA
jgi:hypothetical protein